MKQIALLMAIFLAVGPEIVFGAPITNVPVERLDISIPHHLASFDAAEVMQNGTLYAIHFILNDNAARARYGSEDGWQIWVLFDNSSYNANVSRDHFISEGGICESREVGFCDPLNPEICGTFWRVLYSPQNPANLTEVRFGNSSAASAIWPSRIYDTYRL